MKVTLETDNLTMTQQRALVDIVAAEAVAIVGDLLNDIAQAVGEAPLPMGVFAKALQADNNGCGTLECDDADMLAKGVEALNFLAKEFAV